MAANRPEETNEDANSNTCDHEALLLRTTRLPECPSEEREEETAAALNKKQQPKKQILTHVLPKTLVEKTLPILRLSGLTQFIVGSGAVGLAVGLVVGGCIKDVVDSFSCVESSFFVRYRFSSVEALLFLKLLLFSF